MQTSASDTHPFCLGVGWTVLRARSVAKEVLRNGQAEEDGDARDEEVAHGVHVGELQQGEPHRSWNRNINHDLNTGVYLKPEEKRRENLPTIPNRTQ